MSGLTLFLSDRPDYRNSYSMSFICEADWFAYSTFLVYFWCFVFVFRKLIHYDALRQHSERHITDALKELILATATITPVGFGKIKTLVNISRPTRRHTEELSGNIACIRIQCSIQPSSLARGTMWKLFLERLRLAVKDSNVLIQDTKIQPRMAYVRREMALQIWYGA